MQHLSLQIERMRMRINKVRARSQDARRILMKSKGEFILGLIIIIIMFPMFHLDGINLTNLFGFSFGFFLLFITIYENKTFYSLTKGRRQ